MFEVPSMFRPPSMFGPPPMFSGVAQAATGVESTWCLSFDGTDDRVSYAGTPITGEFTLACWFYCSATNSPNWSTLFRSSSSGYGAFIANGAKSLYIETQFFFIHFTDTNACRGEWVHVAFTRDSSNVCRAYVNGVASSVTATRSGAFSVTGIGDASFPLRSSKVDDCRVYLRGLSQTEVTALYTNTSPPTDVAAYLDLEEGAGTTTAVKDATGATIATATLTNGPVWHPQTPPKLVSGRVTSARSLSFDGVNDWVNLGSGSFKFPVVTVSAWVMRTASLENYDGIVILEMDSSSGNAYGLFGYSGNKIAFDAYGSAGWARSPEYVLPANEWHHVVGIHGSDNKNYLYVDGVLIGSTQGSAIVFSAGVCEAAIGRYGSASTNYFPGLIDDPRIFSRALSATEVQKLCRGQNPTVNDPVGWWPFDETSGTTAVDSGSGGNNGTHVNGPTISTDVPAWLST